MSNANTFDFERNFIIEKNMYEPIYTIRNFRQYSLENSKMAVFPFKSQHQFKIPYSVRDVTMSDLCRKLIFKQKIRFLLEISTKLNNIGRWFSIYFFALSPL